MATIETRRFILRPFTPDDWRDFQALALDWNAAPGPAFDKWDASDDGCRASVTHMATTDTYFAASLRTSGKVVGLLGINGLDDQGRLDLGHVILSAYQDNDHDREVLEAFVRYCRASRGVRALVTHNAPDHAAQLAPLKALGFVSRNPQDPGELVLDQPGPQGR